MNTKTPRRATTADLSEYAFALNLARLCAALKTDADLHGLLLAASSAHDPDPQKQRAVIRFLIRQGADVNETDKNGVTPLHRAVRFRSPAAVKLLLERGANPNAVDGKTQSTPLHRAVTTTGAPTTAGKAKEAAIIIKLLLRQGANPGLSNRMGKTPRDYARDAEIRRLLDRGNEPPHKKTAGRRT